MSDNYEFMIRAALGQDSNSAVNKFGYVSGLVAAHQTVWSHGGLYVYPSSAIPMNISSSDNNDVFGGSGAQQVEVFGLDADYNEVMITLNLNGQTPVLIPIELIRVRRAKIIGNKSNVGTVYVGDGVYASGVPGTAYAQIDLSGVLAGDEENQTLQAIDTVPAGMKGLIFIFSASSAKNEEITVSLKAREFGGVFQTKDKLDVYQAPMLQPYPIPLVFPPKTDIEIRAIGTASASQVSGKFGMVLIPA